MGVGPESSLDPAIRHERARHVYVRQATKRSSPLRDVYSAPLFAGRTSTGTPCCSSGSRPVPSIRRTRRSRQRQQRWRKEQRTRRTNRSQKHRRSGGPRRARWQTSGRPKTRLHASRVYPGCAPTNSLRPSTRSCNHRRASLLVAVARAPSGSRTSNARWRSRSQWRTSRTRSLRRPTLRTKTRPSMRRHHPAATKSSGRRRKKAMGATVSKRKKRMPSRGDHGRDAHQLRSEQRGSGGRTRGPQRRMRVGPTNAPSSARQQKNSAHTSWQSIQPPR